MTVPLSERLKEACTGVLIAEATGNPSIVTTAVNRLMDAAREAAAALEAAREDAERHRWLQRKVSAHGIIDGWTFAFPTHLTLPAPASAMRDPSGALDAAIDQARGKGVAGG